MIGSVFSGIGGLELGLEWAGLGPVAWQVEIEPYCRAVLARHWPEASRKVTDVRVAGASNLAAVDVICGGFPCQDVSSAGKRAGLAGAKSGLWYEYRRIVDELRPRGLVIENVASGAKAWLPQISADLADLGYRARALGVGARDVGAPHRRNRIFVVAVADTHGSEPCAKRPLPEHGDPSHRGDAAGCGGVADTNSEQLRVEQQRVSGRRERGLRDGGQAEPQLFGQWSAEPSVDRGPHGLPGGLDAHRYPARPLWPAGRGAPQYAWEPSRTVSGGVLPHRDERCTALGNAVVPQCASIAGMVLRQMMAEMGDLTP